MNLSLAMVLSLELVMRESSGRSDSRSRGFCVHSAQEMEPFLEWVPLGGPSDRNFDAGARFRSLFLV